MLVVDEKRIIYRPECYDTESQMWVGITANRAIYLTAEDAEDSRKKWIELSKNNPNRAKELDLERTRIVSRVEIRQIGEWTEV